MANLIKKGVHRPAAAKKLGLRRQVEALSVMDERSGRTAEAKAAHRSALSGVISPKGPRFYTDIFGASPEDRIHMIRRGVPASAAKMIIKDLGVEQKLFYDALGFKTSTMNRKAKRNDPLTSDEGERLLGVVKLLGQLVTIISESGDSEGFDAPEWMSRWLRDPLPALGGEKPISFLDTMEGQSLVSSALARIQSGAYA
jgi:putative toxin-antitoxin system antitoxin component (TIGR02293 family)